MLDEYGDEKISFSDDERFDGKKHKISGVVIGVIFMIAAYLLEHIK